MDRNPDILPSPPPSRSARRRWQRRYVSALSNPDPIPLELITSTESASAATLPFPTPSIRSGAGPRNSNVLRHRLRNASNHEPHGTIQETVNDLNVDIVDHYCTSPSDVDQTFLVSDFDGEISGPLEGSNSHGQGNKRRKLDADPLNKQPKINYGYYGQVAPGRLNMMISDYDGGIMNDNKRRWSPENILKNDKSVYCSKHARVNIMLAHHHEIPFTCTKIVIKTPATGFGATLQEGMVFVSMKAAEIRQSAKHFRLETYPRNHSRSPAPEPTRSRTRLRLNNGAWQLEPTEHYLAQRPVPAGDHATSASDLMATLRGSPRNEEMLTLSRQTSTPTTRSAYEEYISMSCETPTDDEDEEDLAARDTTAQSISENRHRRSQPAVNDSEDDYVEALYSSSNRCPWQRLRFPPTEWVGANTTSRVEPPGPDVPYTRFFIERKKHVVSIKFDPPVSGRYIYLKLWSPRDGNNIALESVRVHGFAGPRFFPAVKFR